MPLNDLTLALMVLAALAWLLCRRRALAQARGLGGVRHLDSLPFYHGLRATLWCLLPALLVLGVWLMLDDAVIRERIIAGLPAALRPDSDAARGLLMSQIENLANGDLARDSVPASVAMAADRLGHLHRLNQLAATVTVLITALLGGAWAWARVSPTLRARRQVEAMLRGVFLLCALVAIFTTVGILLSVLFESIRFFHQVSPMEFLFGLQWSPQTALRVDQVASSGAFGAVPLFAGTLLIAAIALLVAVPLGLMSAIYLAEYASPRRRAVVKPALEVLAGVPTVVYGFFAALTVAPWIRDLGRALGLNVAAESALAAGLVMGVMIIPYVSSLADDVITAVPRALSDGSLALGATRSETVRRVLLPAALPGIMGGILLAASRAIGETMIVVMAAGLAANLTANPFQAVTTVTVQIVNLLTGDQTFDSAKTLAAFALGLMLFLTTLVLNMLALRIVRRYREHYE